MVGVRKWLGSRVRAIPSRRRFVLRLFATFVGLLATVVVIVLAVQYQVARHLLTTGDLKNLTLASVAALAVCVLLVVPALYVLGGRTLASRFGAAEDKAAIDGLTELHHHSSFQEALWQEVARARRFSETFTLVLVNVEDFAFVDDNLGRSRGNEILVSLAAALRAGRSVDHLFRVGGDEFAVIMPNTPLDDAVRAVKRFRERAQANLAGTAVSMGLAEFDPAGADAGRDSDAAVLRGRAEAALSEATLRGRNEVVTFPEITQSAPMRSSAAKTTAVRRLLTGRKMGAEFQPIWNLDNRRIIGYEGLARPPAEYGLAGPQDAFSGAARLGRVDELDALCRESVLAGAGDLPDDVLLFLNVAPEVFDSDRAASRRILREVEACGLTPGRVVIELSEIASRLLNLVVSPVHELRELGFRLALDNVGAGDAGLTLLGKVRPDYVKVAPDVVCGALEGGTGRAVLAAVVAYAAESGAIVIAEGIETEEILHHLVHATRTVPKRARFVGGQGYLLGRPTEPPWRSPAPITWPLEALS